MSDEAIYPWIYALPKARWPGGGSCCGPGAPSAGPAAARAALVLGSWARPASMPDLPRSPTAPFLVMRKETGAVA